MRWEGAGLKVTMDDYDDDRCLKGGSGEEQEMFDSVRMNNLRKKLLPELQRLIDDIDKGASTPTLVYSNKKGRVVQAYPHLMLSQIYNHVSKLITLLEAQK